MVYSALAIVAVTVALPTTTLCGTYFAILLACPQATAS